MKLLITVRRYQEVIKSHKLTENGKTVVKRNKCMDKHSSYIMNTVC